MKTQMVQEGKRFQEEEEARGIASEIEMVRCVSSQLTWKN